MIKAVNFLLNQISMYRLMLYYLTFLVGVAVIFSLVNILPFNPWQIIGTTVYLLITCLFFNQIFAKIFRQTSNIESQLITGLILSLIIGPLDPLRNLYVLAVAACVSQFSKYLLIYHNRHIFNPAAFGVLVTALFWGQGASWWVGTPYLQIPILAGGLLIAQKIKRYGLILTFTLTYFLLLFITTLLQNNLGNLGNILTISLTTSPLLFFIFVMLVEPITSPKTQPLRISYGLFTAITLIALQNLLSGVSYTLELSLLLGNLVFKVLSSDYNRSMKLKSAQNLSPNIISLIFEKPVGFQFKAGQFLEWTLPHPHPDSRGIRRYFTIASSPSENFVMLTTRIATQSSSFKQELQNLQPGQNINASGPEGDFILPNDAQKPLVFIAGGIGITPFRSMIKYLLDKDIKQPVTLLYSAKAEGDFVFQNIFNQAAKKMGMKVIYKVGPIDQNLIQQEVKNLVKNIFYLSGPEPMVESFINLLGQMKVAKSQIRADYFPGY